MCFQNLLVIIIIYPLSLIPYPLSLIPYPLSLIPYPLSLIFCGAVSLRKKLIRISPGVYG